MTGRLQCRTDETLACLIIDDPLLRYQYGFMNYQRLLQKMKDHRFFTEIAFIPWNWKRSKQATVRLVADHPDYFGICVHGCNHTGNEFGQTDYQTVRKLANVALWRMEQHQKVTGLPYDPVMVFPQGRFSSTAMQALKNAGYAAAFNSTLDSTDGQRPSLSEFQKPYTAVYHDFPLFLRRYPRDREGFLQDIEAGRPLLIVEHHGAFRNGYGEMTAFIDWLNDQANITWCSLSHIVERYCGLKYPLKLEKIDDLSWPLKERGQVAMRRYASEFRDNLVDRSMFMSKAYSLIRNRN